jgi:1-deoxyxylulose-5-phosphate synthase
LGAGFLTGKYSKSWTAPQGTRFDIIPDHWKVYENARSMERMEKLRGKAVESGRSMVQLALAWVLGQPGITTTLIGSRSTAHIDQAFVAAEAGMSAELRAELNSW